LPRETKHTEHTEHTEHGETGNGKEHQKEDALSKTTRQNSTLETAQSKTQAGTHTIKKAPQYAELSE